MILRLEGNIGDSIPYNIATCRRLTRLLGITIEYEANDYIYKFYQEGKVTRCGTNFVEGLEVLKECWVNGKTGEIKNMVV